MTKYTRATPADIARIWKQLWGDLTPEQVQEITNKENDMSFTFSSNEATDYPALGMCDTCGKRFTQGCEHSNTIEAQEWLAAHIVAEQTISITDEDANDISNLIATAEAEIFTDGFADERIDNGLYDDQPYRPAKLDDGLDDSIIGALP